MLDAQLAGALSGATTFVAASVGVVAGTCVWKHQCWQSRVSSWKCLLWVNALWQYKKNAYIMSSKLVLDVGIPKCSCSNVAMKEKHIFFLLGFSDPSRYECTSTCRTLLVHRPLTHVPQYKMVSITSSKSGGIGIPTSSITNAVTCFFGSVVVDTMWKMLVANKLLVGPVVINHLQ